MIKNIKLKNGFEVHVRYELEPKEIQALKELKEKRFLEFSSMYYNSEGKNTYLSVLDIDSLADNGFIEQDDDAWNLTYVLTELGKKIADELV